MLFPRTLIAGLFVASFLGVSSPVLADPLGMVTGPKTGTYIAMGRDIAEIAKPFKLEVDVKDSSGSIENIKRITSGEKASIGIVQSDVLGFLSRSENPESMKIAEKMRMIFPLHNEEIHVLARKEIASFADLTGKRVIVGTEGSGNMLTSVNLFSLMGVVPDKMFKVEPTKGIVAVLNNEADAIIFVGGKPVRMFKNMEELASIKEGPDAGKLEQVHFLPLNDPRLLKEYATSSLTTADYAFIKNPVPTIAVTAILMAYDFSPQDNKYRKNQCENITELSRIVRGGLVDLQTKGHPKWREVNLNAPVGFWEKDRCAWSEAALQPLVKQVSLEKDLLNVVRRSALQQQQPAPAAPAVAPSVATPATALPAPAR